MADTNPFGKITEKRFNVRKSCDRSVEIVVGDVACRGVMKNICIEGAYVETDRTFEIGKGVTISFRHSSKDAQIVMHGRIVRIDQKGFGVKFKS